jgi:hypothetical protein
MYRKYPVIILSLQNKYSSRDTIPFIPFCCVRPRYDTQKENGPASPSPAAAAETKSRRRPRYKNRRPAPEASLAAANNVSELPQDKLLAHLRTYKASSESV